MLLLRLMMTSISLLYWSGRRVWECLAGIVVKNSRHKPRREMNRHYTSADTPHDVTLELIVGSIKTCSLDSSPGGVPNLVDNGASVRGLFDPRDVDDRRGEPSRPHESRGLAPAEMPPP